MVCLNGTEYSTPSLVKAYARKAQFGQIFTRIQGSYVSLDETIHGFSQIVNGSLDNWSEGAFYLKGTIS